MNRDLDDLERDVAVPPAALDELQAVYAEADRRVAALGFECKMDGACCRFGRSGLELYATLLEAWHLFSRPCTPAGAQRAGMVCPFLDGDRCAHRIGRTLGCRTYACEPRLHEALFAIHEEFLSALKKLHARYGLPYRYAGIGAWARFFRTHPTGR